MSPFVYFPCTWNVQQQPNLGSKTSGQLCILFNYSIIFKITLSITSLFDNVLEMYLSLIYPIIINKIISF